MSSWARTDGQGHAVVLVVVVDDHDVHRRLLRDLLESQGYAVETAEHGRAALPFIESASLVITDLRMPVMDGLALVRTIRAMPDGAPVIVMSAEPEREREALDAGAVAFVGKPASLVALVARIEGLVGAARTDPA